MEKKRSLVWIVARWLAVHILRSARIEVLDAFAYPESQVNRLWYRASLAHLLAMETQNRAAALLDYSEYVQTSTREYEMGTLH